MNDINKELPGSFGVGLDLLLKNRRNASLDFTMRRKEATAADRYFDQKGKAGFRTQTIPLNSIVDDLANDDYTTLYGFPLRVVQQV